MSGIKVVLVIEEMHMHASRKKMSRFDMGEPVMVRVMRQGQNFSISCVAIEQSPSLLDSAILANVATRIVMRLTNSPCVSAIAHSMGLTGPQRDELVELPRRRALVQTADVTKPFLIQVINIQEHERPPEDEMLERERLSLEGLDQYVPRVDVVEVLHADGKEEDDIGMKAIRGDMHKVLVRICEHPCELIEERSDAVCIERAREGRAREKLLKLGLIELGDKVGAKWLLYGPTDKGKTWARSLGLEVPRFKSGVGHEYMVRCVSDSLGGFFGEDIQFFAPGEGLVICGVQPDLLAGLRRIDVKSGFRMAIEISSQNKAKYEARKALEMAGLGQIELVVLVAKTKTHRHDIERMLGKLAGEEGRNGGAVDDNARKDTTHLQETRGRIIALDFETCVKSGYDWSWVME